MFIDQEQKELVILTKSFTKFFKNLPIYSNKKVFFYEIIRKHIKSITA